MYAYLQLIQEKYNVGTVLMLIAIALFSLIYDGRRYRAQNSVKEYKIIRAISYFYITLGIILFILLRIG